MIVVRLLKWLTGYVRLMVRGSFPEHFVNLASRKGVNLWSMEKCNEGIAMFAKRGELQYLGEIADKTECDLHILKEYGLPYLIKKYRNRCGLMAGLVISAGLCFYMSGFVWNISVDVPDSINEYEIRALLREYGVYEGTRSGSIDTDAVVDQICSNDNRISWMTINIMGTDAQIRLSQRVKRNETNMSATGFSNLKSTADGTVTKVNVYNGTANVSPGDGIRKNQLLVSGLVEYTNGKTVLTDAEAIVLARTHRNVLISLPKTMELSSPTSAACLRDIRIFGLTLPLSLNTRPDGTLTKQVKHSVFNILGHSIPIEINEELWQCYEKKPAALDRQQAETILRNRLSLYEFFMLSSSDRARIIHKSLTITEGSDCFTLKADYDLEENVCQRVMVPTELESD